jgi:hypothetical protein
VDAALLEVRMTHLQSVLRNLQKGKAGGPSGWTYEHVRAVADSGPTLSSLLQLINAIFSGRLPHLPALLDGRLIPIEKSPSNSIRPIAIQEVWT